ncbi:phage major capsid protein [Kocuria sp.]|uniref:phage major capsid protein n=1 Tax=Kocuria sp. TaxID=1871328 RepID=UPI0026E03A06|nr:phage major capsid protein [Kocuria sp.]MDO5618768.1 phage major capsid protein [Kocuria sp.]
MDTKLQALTAEAQGIIAAYKAGTMTDAQRNRLNTLNTEIEARKAEVDQIKAGEALVAGIGAEKSTGTPKGQRLTRGAVQKTAGDLAKQITRNSHSMGTKAAITGVYQSEWGENITVYTTPLAPSLTSLFTALPLTLHGQEHYSYLRTGENDLRADTVVKGELKPTSTFGVEYVQDRLRMFAHVSDPCNEQVLEDAPVLHQFLGKGLTDGLLTALDRQLISGRGSTVPGRPDIAGLPQDENNDDEPKRDEILGLANVDGILVVEVAEGVGMLNSIRKAITSISLASGAEANTVVMHPAQYEELELQQLTDGAYLLDSSPVALHTNTLWGLNITLSQGVEMGEAFILDTNAVQLSTDYQGIRLAISNNVDDDFQRNNVRFRAEARFNLDVINPKGVARVRTAA